MWFTADLINSIVKCVYVLILMSQHFFSQTQSYMMMNMCRTFVMSSCHSRFLRRFTPHNWMSHNHAKVHSHSYLAGGADKTVILVIIGAILLAIVPAVISILRRHRRYMAENHENQIDFKVFVTVIINPIKNIWKESNNSL